MLELECESCGAKALVAEGDYLRCKPVTLPHEADCSFYAALGRGEGPLWIELNGYPVVARKVSDA